MDLRRKVWLFELAEEENMTEWCKGDVEVSMYDVDALGSVEWNRDVVEFDGARVDKTARVVEDAKR